MACPSYCAAAAITRRAVGDIQRNTWLSAGGPLGLIGGFGLPSFGCGHGQRFSMSSRRSWLTK